MIRYMNAKDVYFSLSDVADILCEKDILTKKQSQLFKVQCQAYMSKELAKAYKNRNVCEYLQPVILPTSDYFVHSTVWESLLTLLPKAVAQQRKISYFAFMLSEPDSIYRYPATFSAVDLVCLTRPARRRVKSLPGPLVLEERAN